uniref:Uncharacterized protein n=1 Tax=uncultured Desulfobacterium sp. TaxID=201089 RepID=E1Y9G2_9BACT|nr:unknown protein [uncultured Desulfobacterium sp.]
MQDQVRHGDLSVFCDPSKNDGFVIRYNSEEVQYETKIFNFKR